MRSRPNRPQHESTDSSQNFGRLCEWFSAACGCVMLVALAYTALGFDPPQEQGAAVLDTMIGLMIPAGLSASVAVTLRGARQAWLAWISVVPYVVAVALAYAGWIPALP